MNAASVTLSATVPVTVRPMDTIAIPAQSTAVQPEDFQRGLMEGMERALLREPSPPCLLRAPTGSGKTFVISQVLERVSVKRAVLWFWFVPFVTLVQQTEDALAANAPSLSPRSLSDGRNQEAHAGMVLLSTAQGVARAQWRTKGYDADGDDDTRTLAAFIHRARAQGLQLGLVVDEAHIGVDKNTEFGKFAHWLNADYLVMATATPKDERLNEFLAHAGYSAQEAFAVGRDAVVNARLNKKYIEAVVYSLGQTMASIADLRRTVLRQSWLRNLEIEKTLQAAGINEVPLLLVQVANGADTVEEAEDNLMRLCGVPPDAIGKHSSDDPNPVLMASIANNTTKRVLIFKESAGTGFDAPRAFVLASTKPVNSADFAMQFIGRVMRVARPVRDAFGKPREIPDNLNTAYVYLGNAQAQAGFESAVKASTEVKNQLEGQTERLLTRQTVSGAVVYTNRQTDQGVVYDAPTPERVVPTAEPAPTEELPAADNQALLFAATTDGAGAHKASENLWDDLPVAVLNTALDTLIPLPTPSPHGAKKTLQTREEVLAALQEHGLRAYPRKTGLAQLGHCLKTEQKPELDDMSAISRAVASRLTLGDALCTTAVNVALHRTNELEHHTELVTGANYDKDIEVVIDRSALARQAMAALRQLPQAEEEDYKIIVQVLAQRLRSHLDAALADKPEEVQPTDVERKRLARDAAHWVICKEVQSLREDMFSEIALRAQLVDAQPLPDVMVFPADIALESSRKNIYGVLPPSREAGERVDQVLFMDSRQWLADTTYRLDGGNFVQGQFDGTWFGNSLEDAFSRALDRTEFVEWWHRNPRNKPYAVRVVRAEHDNYFYPDFVVCVRHSPGEEPVQRLLETKDDTKDAARKAKHSPVGYGKVLFLTPDGNRMRWVNDDGTLGEVVDFEHLQAALGKLVATRPEAL
ncbi:MAG: DEAD/DEAH box helicase family protein [Burkholderiaceae bacterium]|nr:DEAD/DEAH box helicase family protein [Burkholderiaceae bacterium]